MKNPAFPRLMTCTGPVQHGNLILCAAASSLLISQEPPKPVTWFFFCSSLSHPSLSIFLFCSFPRFLLFVCIRQSQVGWRKEYDQKQKCAENWNLLSSLEAALQISLLFEYIKEYRKRERMYHQFFFRLFFQSYSHVRILEKWDTAICLCDSSSSGTQKVWQTV